MNKNNGNKPTNGYKGKYYDPNYKANKAKYGDLYDPKDFAVLNPNWEPKQNYNRRSKGTENRNNQKRNSNYKGRATNYKGPAHRYNPNYHDPEIMRKTRKRNKTIFFIILIFAILIVTAVKTPIGNNLLEVLGDYSSPVSSTASNSSNAKTVTDKIIEPNIEQLMSNTEVYVDSCDTNGNRQPNAKANIGYDFRNYYGYTNEYSQLVYIQADSLTEQYKSEENSKNRYCDAQANVDGANGSYNRGHGIGDALGGDSNAYNIFPQLSSVNSGGYNDIEMELQNTLYNGGSVTNFELKLTYPNSSTNIPSSYTMSYNLNGEYKEHSFTN